MFNYYNILHNIFLCPKFCLIIVALFHPTMAPVDNTEHLVANALRNANFPTPIPVSRPHGTGSKHLGLGPLPRQPNNHEVDAAREALEQANEEDAFVAYYPNRYNPPTNGLFLLRTLEVGSSLVTGGRMTLCSTNWICETGHRAW